MGRVWLFPAPEFGVAETVKKSKWGVRHGWREVGKDPWVTGRVWVYTNLTDSQ